MTPCNNFPSSGLLSKYWKKLRIISVPTKENFIKTNWSDWMQIACLMKFDSKIINSFVTIQQFYCEIVWNEMNL